MSYETDDKMVSHPDHYKSGKYEVIDIIDEFTKGLEGTEAVCTANAIKYILRWKKKNGIQDVKKAIWYLTHLVEQLENDEEQYKKCQECVDTNSSINADEGCKGCDFAKKPKPKKGECSCHVCKHVKVWYKDHPCGECIGFSKFEPKYDDKVGEEEPDTVFVSGESIPIDKENPDPCVKSHKVICPTTGETVTVPDGKPYDDKPRRPYKKKERRSITDEKEAELS